MPTPVPLALPRSLRPRLERLVLGPALGALVLLAAVALAGVRLPAAVRDAVVAGALLVALAHRGLDPLLPGRVAGRDYALRPAVAVLAIYVALAGAYLLFWRAVAPLALLALAPLLWVHFGLTGLGVARAVGATDHLRTPAQRLLFAVVRGSVPVVVPPLAHAGRYRDLVYALVGPLDPATIRLLLMALDAPFPLLFGGWILSLAVASLLLGYARGGGRAWRVDAAETVALLAFFAVVPPALALAVYAAAWHAFRSLPRHLLLAPGGLDALRGEDTPRALARLGRDAAPLALALAVLIALALRAVGGASAPHPALYERGLVLVGATTLPHAAVGAWVDRRQDLF